MQDGQSEPASFKTENTRMEELNAEYEKIQAEIELATALNRNIHEKLKLEEIKQRNHELQDQLTPTLNPDLTFRFLLMRAIGNDSCTVQQLMSKMAMRCSSHANVVLNDFLLELCQQKVVIAHKGTYETTYSKNLW